MLLQATLALAILTSAWAQPGGGGGPSPFGLLVPAGGGPMPNYFAGTNCIVSGNAQIGEVILQALLKINGELVADYIWDGENIPMSVTLAARFDSSHFPPGTPLQVSLHVQGATTGWQHKYASSSPLATNKVVMYEHPDPSFAPDGPPVVQSHMTGKNYSLNTVANTLWGPGSYFGQMDGSNAVFMVSHGSADRHRAGEDPNYLNCTPIYSGAQGGPVSYEGYRQSQIGTGLPPYNSGAPSVNFMHLFSCQGGTTNNFIRVCYPYRMLWTGNWMENQALLAYGCYVPTSEANIHADLFWGPMSEGETAKSTQVEIETMILNGDVVLHAWTTDPGPIRLMTPNDIKLYAYYGGEGDDGAVRIKSVYTGDLTPPIGWFQELSGG